MSLTFAIHNYTVLKNSVVVIFSLLYEVAYTAIAMHKSVNFIAVISIPSSEGIKLSDLDYIRILISQL